MVTEMQFSRICAGPEKNLIGIRKRPDYSSGLLFLDDAEQIHSQGFLLNFEFGIGHTGLLDELDEFVGRSMDQVPMDGKLHAVSSRIFRTEIAENDLSIVFQMAPDLFQKYGCDAGFEIIEKSGGPDQIVFLFCS